MKKFLFYSCALSFILFVAGCADDDDNNIAAPKTDNSSITIQGKVPNWTGGTGYTVDLLGTDYIAGEGAVGSDGSFSFSPTKVPSLVLEPLSGVFTESTCNISDATVNIMQGYFVVYQGRTARAYLYVGNNSHYGTDSVGSYTMEYWYFDKDVKVTGYTQQALERLHRDTLAIDAHAGWNTIKTMVKENSQFMKIRKVETSPVPAEAKFYVNTMPR